jgi:CheY-like chemotaxis protein
MQPQKRDLLNDGAEGLRRSVHDVAAAIISVRALAEALAEHLPLLVAISRSKHTASRKLISAQTLDALPAIPGEIIELCEIAGAALQGIGKGAAFADEAQVTAVGGAPAQEPDSPPTKINGGRLAVLLVEDEETIQYVMSRTLQAQGCTVTTTSDGEGALRLLEEREFDVVLMDLRMPGMSGWETVERIRQRESAEGRHTRIIGLTASPMLVDQQRARAAGMDDVLVKPIDEKALRSVVSGRR